MRHIGDSIRAKFPAKNGLGLRGAVWRKFGNWKNFMTNLPNAANAPKTKKRKSQFPFTSNPNLHFNRKRKAKNGYCQN